MNNEILTLINQVATKYKLTGEQINTITEKFKDEKRDVTEEILKPLYEEATYAQTFNVITKGLLGDNLISQAVILEEFYNKVNHNAPWDIKRQSSWEQTIGTPFPGIGAEVVFGGTTMTPECLGNLTYGFLGYHYGISLDTLYLGSYYAAGFPTEGEALDNELWDWSYVTAGYVLAENMN